MKTHFLSFGAGNNKYYYCLKNICHQAQNIRCFNTIKGITDKTLEKDLEFQTKHGKFIHECNNNNIRGYGCWIWKPYIIKKHLEQIEENDILVYADAGCYLNLNGKDRLIEYFDIVTKSEYGCISFKHNKEWTLSSPDIGLKEREFTKGSVFDFLDTHKPEITDTPQLIGGIHVMRKCSHVMKIVNLWYETCCQTNLLLDEPESDTSYPDFREHRHDQSIFSVIRKMYGTEYIDNEVYFGSVGWNSPQSLKCPIWAYQLPHKINM